MFSLEERNGYKLILWVKGMSNSQIEKGLAGKGKELGRMIYDLTNSQPSNYYDFFNFDTVNNDCGHYPLFHRLVKEGGNPQNKNFCAFQGSAGEFGPNQTKFAYVGYNYTLKKHVPKENVGKKGIIEKIAIENNNMSALMKFDGVNSRGHIDTENKVIKELVGQRGDRSLYSIGKVWERSYRFSPVKGRDQVKKLIEYLFF